MMSYREGERRTPKLTSPDLRCAISGVRVVGYDVCCPVAILVL